MAPQYAKDQPAGYRNRIEKVAIVGAGGTSGSWIANSLLQNPQFHVTAISRESSTSKLPDGIHKVAKVNYDDENSLVEAMKGNDALILTLAVTAPPEEIKKLVNAAAKAKIPWIMPNEYGVDTADPVLNKETFGGQRKAEDRSLIDAAGIPWIAITCGFWYEFSLGTRIDGYGFDIPGRKVQFYENGEAKMSTSTFEMVGRSAATVLALPILPQDEKDDGLTLEHYRNNFVRVASFTISQREMLTEIQKLTSTTDKDWTITHVDSKELYADAVKRVRGGDRAAFVDLLYGRMFYPDEPGNMEKRYSLDNEKLGLPKEDLGEATARAVKLAEGGYKNNYSMPKDGTQTNHGKEGIYGVNKS